MRIAPFADRLDTVEGRIHAPRRAAPVVAALPPDQWSDRAQRSANSSTSVTARAQRNPPTPTPRGPTTPTAKPAPTPPNASPRSHRPPLSAPVDPTTRWADLADRISPDLAKDRDWPTLAEHISRAADSGFHVDTRLPLLVADRPLDPAHRARDLDLRLIDACPDCLPHRTRLLPMTTENTPHPQRAGGSPRPTASTPMQQFEPANRHTAPASVGRPYAGHDPRPRGRAGRPADRPPPTTTAIDASTGWPGTRKRARRPGKRSNEATVGTSISQIRSLITQCDQAIEPIPPNTARVEVRGRGLSAVDMCVQAASAHKRSKGLHAPTAVGLLARHRARRHQTYALRSSPPAASRRS